MDLPFGYYRELDFASRYFACRYYRVQASRWLCLPLRYGVFAQRRYLLVRMGYAILLA